MKYSRCLIRLDKQINACVYTKSQARTIFENFAQWQQKRKTCVKEQKDCIPHDCLSSIIQSEAVISDDKNQEGNKTSIFKIKKKTLKYQNLKNFQILLAVSYYIRVTIELLRQTHFFDYTHR
jgi:hypothetical protein